ncbi:L-serine ammonia-lyase, iron-sulfur-dependent, subunit alpha [Desulfovibrio mangrovi]|uniref:L-serine ammonia-lyase, iron-sulfur-dependent, subunit alpha n=1 Tax=Desulfovibrio mangrovi TaxID=2976983 RepID=UPI0022474622|nr:L-serine ammonia-lyase, iron-sulfur-dependent, subunit alpha [Desulfovibrio mangrovi]UZP67881.1 L-serine ammonia-lyase, iron-sulfur-dependent, subunit alpha [Desulfovibrio mangrovi]
MENVISEPASIFNDVIGPVMTGPSSSHTAGPARIGKAIHGLVGGISKAVIHFKKDGSYPGTYRGQGTDKGFIGGLLGFGPEHELLGDSLQEAGRRGLEFAFEIEENSHPNPNTARIVVEDAAGNEREFLTESTGGGMFRIVAMDGFPVSVTGEFWELFVQHPLSVALDELNAQALGCGCRIVRQENSSGCLLQVTGQAPFASALLDAVNALRDETECRVSFLDPLLPVAGKFRYDLPFFTAAEALKTCGDTAATAAGLALDYERARSGCGDDDILSRMVDIVRVMRRASVAGMEGELPVSGFLKPKAAAMARAVSEVRLADLGVMNRGMVIATAIMEYNSSGGIVVAAPTAGSCGVLPAAVLSLAESMGLSEAEQAEAMLAAGVVGVFIAHQATFAAEVCACQAEVGAASAMAAAAVVQILGGNASQAFSAAGLALQNVLGLICDPVAGLVEIPCINRNTMGAANAVASANMVMAGFDPVIPLDEVVATMLRVGNMLPAELRCTNRGGLCTTPTACRIQDSLSAR